jgi:hypothetical protein
MPAGVSCDIAADACRVAVVICEICSAAFFAADPTVFKEFPSVPARPSAAELIFEISAPIWRNSVIVLFNPLRFGLGDETSSLTRLIKSPPLPSVAIGNLLLD